MPVARCWNHLLNRRSRTLKCCEARKPWCCFSRKDDYGKDRQQNAGFNRRRPRSRLRALPHSLRRQDPGAVRRGRAPRHPTKSTGIRTFSPRMELWPITRALNEEKLGNPGQKHGLVNVGLAAVCPAVNSSNSLKAQHGEGTGRKQACGFAELYPVLPLALFGNDLIGLGGRVHRFRSSA